MNVQATVNPYIYQVGQFDRNDPRLMTYSEFIAKSDFQAELDKRISVVDGEEIDLSKIDRIDPTKMEWYTVEFEPDVELGVKYMRGCFDVIDDSKYYKLTAAEDFTGMSDAAVYKKYTKNISIATEKTSTMPQQ